jgi:glycosyltransferase involved in cell wall biosynthesis
LAHLVYNTACEITTTLIEGEFDDSNVKTFPAGRKLVDRVVVQPVVRRLLRSLLKSGATLAASRYAKRLLDEIAGDSVVRDVLPIPIDTDFFRPALRKKVSGRIGFSGQLSDPRKNISLLLAAIQHLKERGHVVSLHLIGIDPGEKLYMEVQDLGISDSVEFCLDVSSDELRDKLQTLDVFVVPSHQEGLCISALEAMVCSFRVVPKRCGGPEELVIKGETGDLVGFDPGEMADAVLRLIRSPKIRKKLSEASREKVAQDYSWARANEIFWPNFDESFCQTVSAA